MPSVLEDGFGFIEGGHFAVHGSLYRLGHDELLDALELCIQRKLHLCTLAGRVESKLADWASRTSDHLEPVPRRRIVSCHFKIGWDAATARSTHHLVNR
jgi:hypothetical protein